MATKRVTYVVQVPIPPGGPANSGALYRDYAFEGLGVLMNQGAFSRSTVVIISDDSVAPLSAVVGYAVKPHITVTSGIDYTGDQYLSATGGVPPYTFAATPADVPPGLTIGTDGAITGNATTPGTYIVHVTVTDGIGATAPTTFTFDVS